MRVPTPLQRVKKQFGSKEALVDQLVDQLERKDGENGDDFRMRLLSVSNKKLLRLHAINSRVVEEFRGKEGLVDRIVALKFTHGKGDADYKTKLMSYQITRLLDVHDSLQKRTARS